MSTNSAARRLEGETLSDEIQEEFEARGYEVEELTYGFRLYREVEGSTATVTPFYGDEEAETLLEYLENLEE